MKRRICRRGFELSLICFSICAVASQLSADEPDGSDNVADALRVTTESAKLYEFSLPDFPDRELKLYPKSILRWSNPVAGEVYGNVFVWTNGGRPQVIASIFQWYSPLTHGSHEFHSLADGPLEGRRLKERVWTSPGAGIRWEDVPNAPPVADSPSVRLRHARAISRGFRVEKTDRSDATRQLRMLAQPIYRYGDESSGTTDGMVFVFVQGTDPEVFLLVEAKEDLPKSTWRYALVRMNSVKFVASYEDQEVWRTEIWQWSRVKNGRETYTSFGPFDRDDR